MPRYLSSAHDFALGYNILDAQLSPTNVVDPPTDMHPTTALKHPSCATQPIHNALASFQINSMQGTQTSTYKVYTKQHYS